MAEYKYSDCLFDITKFGGRVKIQDAYPELLPYKDLLKINEKDLKIGILISDMGSPLVKIKDYNQKIREIFNILKIDLKKNKELFENIIDHRVCDVYGVVSFMLEYQNNLKFTLWWKNQEQFDNILKRMSAPKGEEQSEDAFDEYQFKTLQRLDTIRVTLEKLELDLFATAAQKAAVYRQKKTLKTNYAEKHAIENQVE